MVARAGFSVTPEDSFRNERTGRALRYYSAIYVCLPDYMLLPTSLMKGQEEATLAVFYFNSVEGDRSLQHDSSGRTADRRCFPRLHSSRPTVLHGRLRSNELRPSGPWTQVYFRLDGLHQHYFGTCFAYLEGAGIRKVELGAKVCFPPPPHLLAATHLLVIHSTISRGLPSTIREKGRLARSGISALGCTRMLGILPRAKRRKVWISTS